MIKSIIDWCFPSPEEMPTDSDARCEWYARRLLVIANAAHAHIQRESHREALKLAADRLAAIAGLLQVYPRTINNDPNGRLLLDALELAKASALDAREALKK